MGHLYRAVPYTGQKIHKGSGGGGGGGALVKGLIFPDTLCVCGKYVCAYILYLAKFNWNELSC